MQLFFVNPPHASFDNLPSDVLSHIALDTVMIPFNPPTPQDLSTICSLVRTCRHVYEALSMEGNPDLYGQVFRLMFDVEGIGRRLGVTALFSSTLVTALKHRIELLIAIKAFDAASPILPCVGQGAESLNHSLSVQHLRDAFLMITENNASNRFQLNCAQFSRFLDHNLTQLLRADLGARALVQNSAVHLIVPLLWMTTTIETLTKEPAGRRAQILDFLQPLVHWPSSVCSFIVRFRTGSTNIFLFRYPNPLLSGGSKFRMTRNQCRLLP
ncbi:hypothetical protein K439DRAFT_587174 [Ramaria rubella]|nr:hypothetical protein K439DRAFT_587174 [Ramaria rubella]